MSYSVGLTPSAQRKLDQLPVDLGRVILDKLELLRLEPRPTGCKRVVNTRPPGWRIRVRKIRILYVIDDSAQRVSVYDIDRRDKSYKKKR